MSNATYTVVSEVRLALVPSSDGAIPATPSNTAADLVDTQLQDAINEAASQIDSYIGRFYAVPVAAVGNPAAIPHPIDFWCRNIAAYNATLTYRGSQDFSDDDPIARRWKATMDALSLVATGKVALQIPDNTSEHSASGVGPAYNPYIGDLWTPDDFSLSPGRNGGHHYPNGLW